MLGPRLEYKLEGTPLMINSVLYKTGGTRRSVVALDGKTGELMWAHSVCVDLKTGQRKWHHPRHRSASMADRRTSRAAVRRAGRKNERDAAVPDEAAGLRAQLLQAGRSDRLDTGVARAGAEEHRAPQRRLGHMGTPSSTGKHEDRERTLESR